MLTMFASAWGIISITVMVAAGEGLARAFRIKGNLWQRLMIFLRAAPACKLEDASGPHPLARGKTMSRSRRKRRLQIRHARAGNNFQVHSLFNSGDPRLLAHCHHSPKFAASPVPGRFYNEETR